MRGFLRFITGVLAVGLTLTATAARANPLTMGGTGVSLALARVLADAFTVRNPEVTVDMPPSVGSGGGIKALLAGQFGLSFSARPLKDRETAQGAVADVLCRTPFVLAVSDQVAGELSLTGAEILDIFSRETTQWPDGTPITLVFRPPSETGAALLETQFPGLTEHFPVGRASRGAIVAFTDQEMMSIGERNVGSLVFGALVAMKAEKRRLRQISLDGVAPTIGNLSNGSYPMDMTIRTVLGPNPGETALRFRRFTKTPEAATIMRSFDCLPEVSPAPGEVRPRGQRDSDGKEVADLATVP